MNNRTYWELYDMITDYDITIIDDELYLIKDGIMMKLADNESILKQHKERN